jgi:hypothetical protein
MPAVIGFRAPQFGSGRNSMAFAQGNRFPKNFPIGGTCPGILLAHTLPAEKPEPD